MLARAVVVQRRRRAARAGQRHASHPDRRPMRAAFQRAARPAPAWPASRPPARMRRLAACEAQASASSLRRNRSASAAPLSTSGSAWIALTAERGNTGCSTSPIASTALPSASNTATAPRWRLSTWPPRSTSTRTGLSWRRSALVVDRSNSTLRRPSAAFPVPNRISSISSLSSSARASAGRSSWLSASLGKCIRSRSATRRPRVILPASQPGAASGKA